MSRLLKDAPPDSIKQTINVEREEEEIIGPLPEGEDGSDGMLNFDTVSEKVDMGIVDGVAQVAVKVRCERVVPIRGIEDMFKKSSVIVTRLIEIDLTATEERRRLYDHVMRGSTNQHDMLTESGEHARSGRKSGAQHKLTTKQTFNLYKTFMGLAEADEKGKKREHMQIDRHVEEQRLPQLNAETEATMMNGQQRQQDDDDEDEEEEDEDDTDIEALERRLEEQIMQYSKTKPPEPDTISYMSAASEINDILY